MFVGSSWATHDSPYRHSRFCFDTHLMPIGESSHSAWQIRITSDSDSGAHSPVELLERSSSVRSHDSRQYYDYPPPRQQAAVEGGRRSALFLVCSSESSGNYNDYGCCRSLPDGREKSQSSLFCLTILHCRWRDAASHHCTFPFFTLFRLHTWAFIPIPSLTSVGRTDNFYCLF